MSCNIFSEQMMTDNIIKLASRTPLFIWHVVIVHVLIVPKKSRHIIFLHLLFFYHASKQAHLYSICSISRQVKL